MLAACMGALLSAVGDRGGGGHGGSHGVRSCFQVTRDRDWGGAAEGGCSAEAAGRNPQQLRPFSG